MSRGANRGSSDLETVGGRVIRGLALAAHRVEEVLEKNGISLVRAAVCASASIAILVVWVVFGFALALLASALFVGAYYYFAPPRSSSRVVNPFDRALDWRRRDMAARIMSEWDEAMLRARLTVEEIPKGMSVAGANDMVNADWTRRQREYLRHPHAGTVFPRIISWDSHGVGVTALVEMIPGQTLSEWEKHREGLRQFFRVLDLRIQAADVGYLYITATYDDPLAISRVWDPRKVEGPTAQTPVLLGFDENGGKIEWNLANQAQHGLIQAQTRGGKSQLAYTILAQAALRPDVDIRVIDVNETLSRPFHGVVAEDALDAYEQRLTEVTRELRRRLTIDLPAQGRDKVTEFTPDTPVILLVIDEYAGLIGMVQQNDQGVPVKERRETRIRGMISDLLAQGAKVGIRVLLITQRADAAIVGGFDRSNIGLRITMRMKSVEGVRMLFPDLDTHLAEKIPSFAPGMFVIETGQIDPTLGRSTLFPPGTDDQYRLFSTVVGESRDSGMENEIGDRNLG